MSCALADPSVWDENTDSAPGPTPAPGPPTMEVRAVFRGVVTQARILSFSVARGRRVRRQFTIGSEAGVDAPVAPDFLPWPSHPLVMAAGFGYVVNVTPQMKGQVRVGERRQTLAAFTRENGTTFALPPRGSVRLDCGATSFIVSRVSPPLAISAPPWRWSWPTHAYGLASAAAFTLLLWALAFIPSDPRALSLDLLAKEAHFLRLQIVPPLVDDDPVPEWTRPSDPSARGGAAPSAPAIRKAETRVAPSSFTAAPSTTRVPATAQEVRWARAEAVRAARMAGILGVLELPEGAAWKAAAGAEGALGPAAEEVLGNLVGVPDGVGGGAGPWGGVGTGAKNAGTGEGLRGEGALATFGDSWRGGRGPGGRGGTGPGTLVARHARAPEWTIGNGQVRGALDKEIVRRTVRRHLNEVRYCYEQELVRVPTLGGRVVVQFTIAGTGRVATSALVSSTMGNVRVESCVVQAVRRWEFPQPNGGGLVMVSYPFVLAPAGGG